MALAAGPAVRVLDKWGGIGAAAAPVFSKVVQGALRLLNVTPGEAEVVALSGQASLPGAAG